MTEQSTSPHIISLPDGDVLMPRPDFARELKVHPKTVRRMNLPTVYVGNKAYIKHEAALEVLAATVVRRNQPKVTPKAPKRSAARR
jgi:hypothetical protein